MYVDQPIGALEKAIWWIEYVIRHKGAQHLMCTSMDIPWYQYLMLDIFAFLSIVITGLLLIMYGIIKLIVSCVRAIIAKKTCDKDKKNK